jgi:hypothetical protein
MEHIVGDQWWTAYQVCCSGVTIATNSSFFQPVSYTITSNRGNRDQFANMVATCNAAGVQVRENIPSRDNYLKGMNRSSQMQL